MFSQTSRLIKSTPQSFNLETTSATFVHAENIYRIQICTVRYLVFYRYTGIRNGYTKNATYILAIY